MMLGLLIALLVLFSLALLSWWRSTRATPAEVKNDYGPTITISCKSDGQIIMRLSQYQAHLLNAHYSERRDGCTLCRRALGDGTVIIVAPPHPRWGAVLAHPRCMQGLKATVTP